MSKTTVRTPRMGSMSVGSQAKNRAFVFIKPHAVTDAVKELVSKQLNAKGIDIVGEGKIDAEAIDKGMLIDRHYYAIASKATLLKPDKLPVPEAKFKDKFGLEFSEALKHGSALNARDACEVFGVDALSLGEMWKKAAAAGDLVKFSGGFYCAKMAPEGKGTFYVFNGFFMEMRNKYVAKGAEIYYYLAEWSPLDLSWADFRNNVLGPTDPSKAPADSVRGLVFSGWKDLGLPSEPNTGDNGVHASASPMEALFERMNWLNIEMADDPFGLALMQHDVTPELIEEWRRDPQVSYGRGATKTKGSLYDALEDLDVDRCRVKCQDIARTGRTHVSVHKNMAFCFIKPHAVTTKVKDLVRRTFEERGLRVMQEGVIEAEQIDQDMLVDKHYYAIASKATLLTPDKLPVPADKFEKKFGIPWPDALKAGTAINAKDACDKFGISAAELGAAWNVAKKAGDLIKFSGGFYCAKMELAGQGIHYVLNGFFMEMRDKFVKQGAEIHYFLVEWDPIRLSWSDFRGELLGPTDPTTAPENSIRGMIFKDWESLGLSKQPDMGDNGVHASASPIEALFERLNWLGGRLERDHFGKLLIQGGVTESQIEDWSKDPQINYGLGKTKGSFYDCMEDKDSDMCMEECIVIARVGHTPTLVRNSAFVFIKPHAVTDQTKELVKKMLVAKGLSVLRDGLIDAATIDKDMLIDKHYYAIASKATLVTPDKLPVPADKFEKQFGLPWDKALETGNVLNAIQACERMNLDAAGLGEKWNEAKQNGALVKFGGGFYCAKIEMALENEGRCSFYVFNGFFMEMRNKYVATGAAIHYFVVEWDPLDLSWSDFRGQLLGATDPTTAPEDSIRGTILAQWKDLGLASEPNIADNGVHASASPFEALSERMNWLGVKSDEDAFGQLLLHGGVTMKHMEEWALDPRVTYTSQKKEVTTSLYDALEDLDADRCVTQCQIIVGDSVSATSGPDVLTPEQSQSLHKRGHTLKSWGIDGYDCYTFKYILEDPDIPGPIWEVERKQMNEGRDNEPIWIGKKLTVAEAQAVLKSMDTSKIARSPLTNRLP